MSNLKIASTPETVCCDPDCCGGTKTDNRAAHEVTAVVREQYGRTAKNGLSSNDSRVRAVAAPVRCGEVHVPANRHGPALEGSPSRRQQNRCN